jgi:hypothetical protein
VIQSAEAMTGLKVIKNFYAHKNREPNLQKLSNIENSIHEIVDMNEKQTKITYF